MSSDQTQKPKDNVSGSFVNSTLDTFADRIQRKLKAREAEECESAKVDENRQAEMLKAITAIRKGLQEASKINLGSRFHFQFEVNEWEGWPRIELNLIDSFAPDSRTYGLEVTANDRTRAGAIMIKSRSSEEVLARLEMADEVQRLRLPHALKKALRDFLDTVGTYILNPARPEDLLEVQTNELKSEHLDETDQQLQKQDMFMEHDFGDQNVLDCSETGVPGELESAEMFVDDTNENDNLIETDDSIPYLSIAGE